MECCSLTTRWCQQRKVLTLHSNQSGSSRTVPSLMTFQWNVAVGRRILASRQLPGRQTDCCSSTCTLLCLNRKHSSSGNGEEEVQVVMEEEEEGEEEELCGGVETITGLHVLRSHWTNNATSWCLVALCADSQTTCRYSHLLVMVQTQQSIFLPDSLRHHCSQQPSKPVSDCVLLLISSDWFVSPLPPCSSRLGVCVLTSWCNGNKDEH